MEKSHSLAGGLPSGSGNEGSWLDVGITGFVRRSHPIPVNTALRKTSAPKETSPLAMGQSRQPSAFLEEKDVEQGRAGCQRGAEK